MQERVLAQANREADRLNRLMRGFAPQTTALNRRWVVGQGGEMYHFDFFDPMADRFSRLRVYHLDLKVWRLRAMTYADDAVAARAPRDGEGSPAWTARRGWRREFTAARQRRPDATAVRYTPFDERNMTLRSPLVLQERCA